MKERDFEEFMEESFDQFEMIRDDFKNVIFDTAIAQEFATALAGLANGIRETTDVYITERIKGGK